MRQIHECYQRKVCCSADGLTTIHSRLVGEYQLLSRVLARFKDVKANADSCSLTTIGRVHPCVPDAKPQQHAEMESSNCSVQSCDGDPRQLPSGDQRFINSNQSASTHRNHGTSFTIGVYSASTGQCSWALVFCAHYAASNGNHVQPEKTVFNLTVSPIIWDK